MKKLFLSIALIGFMVSSYSAFTVSNSFDGIEFCEDNKKCEKKCSKSSKKKCCKGKESCKKGEAKKECGVKDKKSCHKKKSTENK